MVDAAEVVTINELSELADYEVFDQSNNEIVLQRSTDKSKNIKVTMKPSQDLAGFEWIGLPDCLRQYLCLGSDQQELDTSVLPDTVLKVIRAFRETAKVTN